ncbi:diguanylate cyclase domain-containing protein [Aquihabitans sp. McL0605]|uniref:sensor domain-containing protein n=1 Tax=Aquihabitans sp. McL0605 TaxID=3415671 RepID=UPI003CE6CAED
MVELEGTGASGHDRTPAAAPRASGSIPAAWLQEALTQSSDLVLVIDAGATILWCNGAVRTLLGYDPDAVIGRSFAEFVHPDDLGRAGEVMALTVAGAFDETPITPALYRTATSEGQWVDLEVNASSGPDGSLLIVARSGGDLVLTDRLLEAVSGNVPFELQVEMVMEMGRWRHPCEGYAILYRGEHGEPRAITSDLPAALHGSAALDGRTPWDVAMAAGTEVVIDDLAAVAADSEIAGPELVAAALAAGFSGCLAAPVPDPDHPDHPGGACIAIWTSADGPTTSGHRYAMSNMRRAFALVLQQRAQVRGLERAARVDQLTGLTSRARFLELVQQVGAQSAPNARHALLYIDLDGFKAVNDSLGHAAGDLVLTVTAVRITEVVADGAVVARLGGDEFGVLCPIGTTEAEAAGVAEDIIDAVAGPIVVGDTTASVGCSIGLAIGVEGQSPELVLDAADVALLAAKVEGRGRWRSGSPA